MIPKYPHLLLLSLLGVAASAVAEPLSPAPTLEAPFELEQVFHFPTPRERYEDGLWDWHFYATKTRARVLFDVPVEVQVLDLPKEEEFSPPFSVPSATLTGYQLAEYYEEVGPLTLTLHRLRPDSAVYLRAYSGKPKKNPVRAVVVEGSYHVVTDESGRDVELTIEDINPHLVNHGWHTLEVVQEHQGELSVLFRSRIQVDRTVILPAGIYTRE